MFLFKLVRSIIKALHSDGTPGQVAMGIALGSILGLTPLVSLHNAPIIAVILLLNVSVPGAMLGWLVFVPLGFILDPVFDTVGDYFLMDAATLEGFWSWSFSRPVIALMNFNNTIVLGSFLISVALFVPIFYASRFGVTRYRATIAERIRRSAFYKMWKASKLYSVYKLFQPRT
jgi:uncharacterized protein (TIGR03546 family)